MRLDFFTCPTWFFVLSSWLFLAGFSAHGQTKMRVEGKVIDSRSKEPLSFATVNFTGTDIGTTTDNEGFFELEADQYVDSITVSFIGFDPQTIALPSDLSRPILIALDPTSLKLATVDVTARRERYRRKDNPAVELIKNVIDHRDRNRLEFQDFYQHQKYEKIEFDLANIQEWLVENKALKSVDFIFNNLDTTAEGVAFLPFFLQESIATVYFRKQPEAKKEYREGLKVIDFDDFTSDQSIYNQLERLYQEVDIYQTKIHLFDNQFVSPLAPIAPSYYRYYISDTLEYEGQPAIVLDYIPNNKYNLGFTGSLFIKADSTYQVIGITMGLLDQANLNFVKSLKIALDFEEVDSVWVVRREVIETEFSISDKLVSIFGKKTTINGGYRFEEAADPSVYQATGNLIPGEGESQRDEAFWKAARPEPLTSQEAAIYTLVDTLRTVPFFRTASTIIRLSNSGYFPAGPFDIGSLFTFLSFNDVEGWRFKFGGRTNGRFHDHLFLRGYGAYGIKDRQFKYSGTIGYAFDQQYQSFPRHYLAFTAKKDNKFPGLYTQYFQADNFFLSFRTGLANKMLSDELYQLQYNREWPSNILLRFNANLRTQEAAGAFAFRYYDETEDVEKELEHIATAETEVMLRFAPNARYFEGNSYRYPLTNRYPIIDLTYRGGWKAFGGDYEFHSLDLGITKRFFLSAAGFTDFYFNMGKVWGEGLPYILLHMPRANQTFGYQDLAFNVMNFLEFVVDEYASVHLEHEFNGFLFNKVPLLRKLKLRSIVGFKALFGNLTNVNNPNLHRELVQFPTNEAGDPETFPLDRGPYMEFNIGISNILKVFRVDFVRRLNYLDNPNIAGLFGVEGSGLRLSLVIAF